MPRRLKTKDSIAVLVRKLNKAKNEENNILREFERRRRIIVVCCITIGKTKRPNISITTEDGKLIQFIMR